MAAVCVIFFTLNTDPYRLYSKQSDTRQDKGVDLFYHLRLHKPYAIERLKPKLLIAGSSRSARLAPVEGDLIALDGYNASLPGATLTEIRRIIEHAHVIAQQQRVVIGLDYYMFDSSNTSGSSLLVNDRFLSPDIDVLGKLGHWFQHLEDYWRTLFSIDAVLDSIRAKRSSRSSVQLYREDGTWEIAVGTLTPAWFYSALAKQIYQEFTNKPPARDYVELRRLLDALHEEQIEVQLLIAPMNGLLLETVQRANAWASYTGWQRQLVEIANEYKPTITIYGLENNADLVLEKVNAENPLFRDGVHLTRRASSHIFECLMDECRTNLKPQKLLPEALDSYFSEIDRLRLQYLEENPKYVKKLSRWLSD